MPLGQGFRALNATQLHREGVRRALRSVDNNILKLDSAFDATARLINNPQSPVYSVRRVVDQMKGFDGHLTVQTMFLRGEFDGQRVDNTTEEGGRGMAAPDRRNPPAAGHGLLA